MPKIRSLQISNKDTCREQNPCPHCGAQPAPIENEETQAIWKMMHLLDHALASVVDLDLKRIPDMSYSDYVDDNAGGQNNTWQAAARNASACLVHEMFPTLAAHLSLASELEELGALGECKPDSSPRADNWGKGMYFWLRQHYPIEVKPWCDRLEQWSRGGTYVRDGVRRRLPRLLSTSRLKVKRATYAPVALIKS